MPKKSSEARLRANAKSDKKCSKGLYLKLNKNTDADILNHLGELPNKQGYIKGLIRDDMKKGQVNA